jgi:hypothetical protein
VAVHQTRLVSQVLLLVQVLRQLAPSAAVVAVAQTQHQLAVQVVVAVTLSQVQQVKQIKVSLVVVHLVLVVLVVVVLTQ